MGGNEQAAHLSGIRVDLVRIFAFTGSDAAAGLEGIIVASRVASSQVAAGQGLEFAVIAAIVVGGNSIFGGEGAVWRTVIGALFVALIANGFTLLSLDPIYQQIVTGAIIILAVLVDAWARRH